MFCIKIIESVKYYNNQLNLVIGFVDLHKISKTICLI